MLMCSRRYFQYINRLCWINTMIVRALHTLPSVTMRHTKYIEHDIGMRKCLWISFTSDKNSPKKMWLNYIMCVCASRYSLLIESKLAFGKVLRYQGRYQESSAKHWYVLALILSIFFCCCHAIATFYEFFFFCLLSHFLRFFLYC